MTSMIEPKTCRTCGRTEPHVKFGPRRRVCYTCVFHQKLARNPDAFRGQWRRGRLRPRQRFSTARYSAGRRGWSWELSFETWLSIAEQPCVYCGYPPAAGRTGGGLDRKDSARGYEVDNVVPCCTECNLAKLDHFTYDEMLVIGAAIRQVKDARRSQAV